MAWIKNINKANIYPCNCGSWYKHWVSKANQWLICCAEYSCINPIHEAVPVQDAEQEGESDCWYVIPLCKAHANHDEILDIGEARLIIAAPDQGCKSE